jgi:hypothetical protein
MSNPKDKETTDFTVQDLIDDAVEKFGIEVDIAMKLAQEGGKYGVMVVGTEAVFVCDLVPYGKVYRAGSMSAVDKLRQNREKAQEK